MKTKTLMLLLAIFIASCSPKINIPATRPDDFSLVYHWQEGSLPPPYHYEYSIIIQSDRQGHIEMLPDYPSDQTPVWEEVFTVTADDLDQLYALLLEKNFFQENWTAQDGPPVGGSSEQLVVSAQGQDYAISSFVLADQQSAASEIMAYQRAGSAGYLGRSGAATPTVHARAPKLALRASLLIEFP